MDPIRTTSDHYIIRWLDRSGVRQVGSGGFRPGPFPCLGQQADNLIVLGLGEVTVMRADCMEWFGRSKAYYVVA